MTVPIPPTASGTEVSAEARAVLQEPATSTDIVAPLPELSAMTAEAQAAGEAWQAGGAAWADSPQGAGLGGWTLGGDHPSGADGDWPASMSFPHQGP